MIDVDKIPVEQLLVFGNMRAAVFYKTHEWKKARYNALILHGNSCKLCGRNPSHGVQIGVDHIKPRYLYPELCLDLHNLQPLCSECHQAKGAQYADDCRSKVTKELPLLMRECLQLSPRHIKLQYQAPTRNERKYYGGGIKTQAKRQKKRWNVFVDYLYRNRLTYNEAIRTTVLDMHSRNEKQNERVSMFTYMKEEDDLLFTIDGCRFPDNIRDLISEAHKSVNVSRHTPKGAKLRSVGGAS